MSPTLLFSGCKLECETSGEIFRDLDMKNWKLSKFIKTFIS